MRLQVFHPTSVTTFDDPQRVGCHESIQLLDDFRVGPKLRKLRPRPHYVVEIEHLEIVPCGELRGECRFPGTGIAEEEDSHGSPGRNLPARHSELNREEIDPPHEARRLDWDLGEEGG